MVPVNLPAHSMVAVAVEILRAADWSVQAPE